MIDFKELMIGNWVYNTFNDKPERVAEVRGGMVMLDYNDLYEEDEIDPIPITREILKKNGFCSFLHDSVYSREAKGVQVKVQFEVLDMELDEPMIKVDSMGGSNCVPKRYIHQLQNILNVYGFDWIVEV